MAFQKTVNRNFTQGLIGTISNDGPTRALPAIIAAKAGAYNRVGRAFGYKADIPTTGTTKAALENTVEIGAAPFFGILGAPKHYALFGNAVDGPLGPTLDLPANSEGEFFSMAFMVLAVSLGRDAAVATGIPYGTPLYYANAVGAAAAGFVATTIGDVGRIYAFPGLADLSTVPARFTAIPGSGTVDASTASFAPATPNPDGAIPTDAGAVVLRCRLTQ